MCTAKFGLTFLGSFSPVVLAYDLENEHVDTARAGLAKAGARKTGMCVEERGAKARVRNAIAKTVMRCRPAQ